MKHQAVFIAIHKALLRDDVQLPAMPDVALRLQQSSKDPDCDLNDLAQLIQTDAALVAYLLRVSNNPLYRGVQSIASVTMALNRLGLETTANLAISYSLQSLFQGPGQTLEQAAMEKWLTRIWKLSTRLAALASVLAKYCQGFDPDRALIAGLMQDIGALPLIQQAAQYPQLIGDDQSMARLLEKYTATVGAAVLKQWGLEESLIDVARSRKDWLRDSTPAADYADLVMVARLHRYMGTKLAKKLPRLGDIPAFKKIAPGNLSVKQSLSVLDEAKQDVADIEKLLNP